MELVPSPFLPWNCQYECLRGTAGTGYVPMEGGTQRGEIRLLLRLIPPDDIRNTTAIAKENLAGHYKSNL